ncbi:hypothetical protein, partial [Hydrogenophaga sp.]|uniref:hypothetical protein n=1 Tax=Hydrogenophaga sp. TaxID=1904254 RepID=UPI003563E8BF
MIERLEGALCAKLRWLTLIAMLLPFNSMAKDSCEAIGVVFGFFNGVKTTDVQGNLAVAWIRKLYPATTPSGEPITYELFYNDTEGFSDFVETFEQRLQEHTGLLAGRFELFFSAIQGGGSWWDALTSAIPALTDLPVLLADTFRASLVRELTANFGQPETFKVAQRHRDQLTHWISLDKKLLLLAHSQGNLFVNAAYDHAVALSDPKSVRVVHVAPASPRATGPHTLADLDLVINGLRLVGKVLPVTNSMVGYGLRPKGLNGERDAVGHGLLEIYLNPAVSTASRIRDHVMAALRELESPPRKPWAPYPDFASIPWAGGEEPGALYSPVTPSHELNKVVLRRSHPFVFVRRVDAVRGAYWTTPHVDGPEQGWSRTEFQGRGVDGSVQCTWGRSPVPGWLGPLPW